MTSSGNRILEKDATLAVGLEVRDILRARGFTVVLSRRSDTQVSRLNPGDLDGAAFSAAGAHRDVEALFLTHPPEADVAASIEGQRAIAEGIARGVDTYVGS